MGKSTKAKKKNHTPLLLRVMSLLGDVECREQWIPPIGNNHTAGLWEKDGDGAVRITVNLIPDAVDSIIHEAIHSLYPDYSERQVKRLTTQVVSQLTGEEMQTIYYEFMDKVDKDKG
jgi:hypothetical protein